MRSLTLLSHLLLIMLILPATGQVRVNGSLQSSLYTFQNPEGVSGNSKQGNFYQGLQLRLSPDQYQQAYFRTYLRVAKFGEQDWQERVYNMYLNWKSSGSKMQIRLGRQFLYQGVINGTMDGVLVGGKLTDDLDLKLFAGIEAPFDRGLTTAGSDSNAFGAYLSYDTPWDFKVDFSYFQRSRNEQTVWRVAGMNLNGVYKQNLYYQARIEHNLETEKLAGMRYRLTYYYNKWSFSGEYSQQEPRILEDSFFRIFRVEAYGQIRGGVTYQINSVQIGFQHIFTDYEIEQGNQSIISLANRWGFLGVVYQEGYGGKNSGVYGQVKYDLLANLTAKLYSSYYNFERQTTEISEDATSFSGGLTYRPWSAVRISAEVQESINSNYDNDLRGLFRLNYAFNK